MGHGTVRIRFPGVSAGRAVDLAASLERHLNQKLRDVPSTAGATAAKVTTFQGNPEAQFVAGTAVALGLEMVVASGVHHLVDKSLDALSEWLNEHDVAVDVETEAGRQSIDSNTPREAAAAIVRSALSSRTPAARENWLVCILGASHFPHMPQQDAERQKNLAFEKSCLDWRKYLVARGVPEENICWLLNPPLPPPEVCGLITQFIRTSVERLVPLGVTPTDLLIVFVGHGDGKEVEYSLIIDSDAVDDAQQAALRFDLLAREVKQVCDEVREKHQAPLRQFFVIDACFAARARYAVKTLGSPAKSIRQGRGGRAPGYGIAALCSCNEDEESLTLADGSRTFFSDAVLHILDASDESARSLLLAKGSQRALSLNHLRELAAEWVKRQTPAGRAEPPTPVIVPIDTTEGDIQDVPLWPNPLARKSHRTGGRKISRRVIATAFTAVVLVLGIWGVSKLLDHSEVEWTVSAGEPFGEGEKPPEYFAEVPKSRHVTYEAATDHGSSTINYHAPYLEDYREGKPVEGANFAYPLFAAPWPVVSCTVVNNSEKTMLLSEVKIHVDEVKVDERPILVVQDRSFNQLLFRNEGWGEPADAIVRFSFLPNDQPAAWPERLEHEQPLTAQGSIKIVPFVPPQLAQQAELRVAGEVRYGSPPEVMKFRTTVLQELPSGRPTHPSAVYDIKLKSDGSQRDVNRSLKHEIKSRETDEIGLRVASDKSARYDLSIELVAGEENLESRRLHLNVFVPRSAAGRQQPEPKK